MKAALLREFSRPLVIEEVPEPEIGPDEVLVRVMACGIDGTDLKLLDGFGYTPELPFVMGHEPAGAVERVGRRVSGFRRGDRVIPYLFFTCGQCALCLGGREQLCPNLQGVLGVRGHPGGYAEYLKVPSRQLVPLLEGIPWPDAAVLCDAGVTAFHAMARARIRLGETALVIGVGGVGSFAVQFARLAGARVIAVEQGEAKAEWARQVGAEEVIDSSRQEVAQEARQLTDGAGVECVLDTVGKEATLKAGIESLAHGGRLVVIGYTPEEYALSGKYLAQNEIEIIGTRCGTRQDLRAVAQLVAAGKVRSIVTQRRPLAQANEALGLLREGKVQGRLVLQIAEER